MCRAATINETKALAIPYRARNHAAAAGARNLILIDARLSSRSTRYTWLFAGSDRGGVRAAVMYTLIGTAKLNDIDPQAWLADVLDRIADLPQTRLHELLPWHWKAERQQTLAA